MIFMHCRDAAILQKSIGWMKMIVRSYPKEAEYIDTYANLLYKTGKRKEAMLWEQKALLLSPGAGDILANYAKMKKGEATWTYDL